MRAPEGRLAATESPDICNIQPGSAPAGAAQPTKVAMVVATRAITTSCQAIASLLIIMGTAYNTGTAVLYKLHCIVAVVPYSCSTCNHLKVIHMYTDVLVLASTNNVILASIRIWYWHNRYSSTKIKFSTGAADAEQNCSQSRWSVIHLNNTLS